MKITPSLVKVATALLDAPKERHWGYRLSVDSGVRSGVLYPILGRMMDEGWLTDGWEDPSEANGRPPRRYYEITDTGLRELGAAQSRFLASQARMAATRPQQARPAMT